MTIRTACLALATVAAVPAAAQDAAPMPFAGGFAGVEGGAVDHMFRLETTTPAGQVDTNRFNRWGVAAGAFGGYDAAVSRTLRLGVEGGVTTGGRTPSATFGGGLRYAQAPQWGWRIGGRAGVVVADSALLYATLGYGAHRYRLTNTANIANVDNWDRNAFVGAGVEGRLARNVGLRLDVRHLAGITTNVMLGVPVRF